MPSWNALQSLCMEFAVGNLNSQSSMGEIVREAAMHLRDAGLPDRKSLCIMLAKRAMTNWHGKIIAAKNAIA